MAPDKIKQPFRLEAPSPSQSYHLDWNLDVRDEEQPIQLNIAEVQLAKQLIQEEQMKSRRTSGNPIIDLFYRINDWLIDHSSVHVREKATFFRLLAVMINAGVPVVRALDTLSAQMTDRQKFSRVTREIARKIEKGKKLSDAMKDYPEIFNDTQAGMVNSGEATGQLNKVLDSNAVQVEKSSTTRKKVIGALIYPMVVICLLIIVTSIMMIVVVPKMKEFFVNQGHELPTITNIMIDTSDFMSAHWTLMLLGIIGFFLAFNVWKKTPFGRYQWDSITLRIPLAGNLIQKSTLAQFSRAFSDLLSSGIGVTQALRIIARATNNAVYQKQFLLAAQEIEQGIPLAETLNNDKLFPPLLVNMFQVGEQTAHLDTVSEKVANYFDEEVDSLVQGLTKSFEPIMIVGIGLIVGGMVAAILLPIMDLSNTATSGL